MEVENDIFHDLESFGKKKIIKMAIYNTNGLYSLEKSLKIDV